VGYCSITNPEDQTLVVDPPEQTLESQYTLTAVLLARDAGRACPAACTDASVNRTKTRLKDCREIITARQAARDVFPSRHVFRALTLDNLTKTVWI
jgi:hypothetical protein